MGFLEDWWHWIQLVGGWALPLWKIRVHQLGWWHIRTVSGQTNMFHATNQLLDDPSKLKPSIPTYSKFWSMRTCAAMSSHVCSPRECDLAISMKLSAHLKEASGCFGASAWFWRMEKSPFSCRFGSDLELNQTKSSTFWTLGDPGNRFFCHPCEIDCIFDHRCPAVSKITCYFCHPNGEKNWVCHSVLSGYADWHLSIHPKRMQFVIRSAMDHLASPVPGS